MNTQAKKTIYLLALFYFSIQSFGQVNLVPNPSFESYTYCPTAMGGGGLNNWENYSYSPDYFNSCANVSNSYLGVPSNLFGWQNAADGNGYIGLLTFNMYSHREVLGVQLTQSLTIGTKYFVSFYASKPDTSNGASGYKCITDKLGARLSTKKFTTSSIPINNFAHIYSNIQINDTLGWTKISGNFIADSSYTYLMLGNFFNNANTNYTGCSTTNSSIFAYYYLDKVCVSTDSTLCNGSLSQVSEFSRKSQLFIYPNPSSNILNISITQNNLQNSELEIINYLGQTILKTEFKNQIDVSELANGFYTLLLKDDSGSVISKKFVKE